MRSSERGTTLIEFAFIVLVLFSLIFGIIDFGRALFAYHFVANAAREGARYASVRGADCTSPMTNCYPAARDAIQTNLQNEASSIGLKGNLVATTNYPPQTNSPSACTSGAPNAEASPGCTVQVNVSYTFQFIFPFLPTSPVNMSSTSSSVITQ